jgi:hypothetical protein
MRAPKMASVNAARSDVASIQGHRLAWPWLSHQPAARTAPAVTAGAISERYRHAHRARRAPAGTSDGLSMTTMGCRPALRARRVCLRICR